MTKPRQQDTVHVNGERHIVISTFRHPLSEDTVMTVLVNNHGFKGEIPLTMIDEYKPRTIWIGDMQVPEPVREPLAVGQTYWLVDTREPVRCISWGGGELDYRWLRLGIIQKTMQGAIQHRAALIRVSGGTLD